MALEDRVKELEEELKVLKNEIQTTLLDIQEQILSHYYPSLYPSANKEANLAQANAAFQQASASNGAALPQQAPNQMAQAAVQPEYEAPPARYHGKYKTQTVTLVEEPEEEEPEEDEPPFEEEEPVRLAVVPQKTHKKSKPSANGHSTAQNEMIAPHNQELTAEDEDFLDAIIAKGRRVTAKETAVSFDEFKQVMYEKGHDNDAEEELLTEDLLDELLKDSLFSFNQEHLNSVTELAPPDLLNNGLTSPPHSIDKLAVRSTVKKLLHWVDESVAVIGKDPSKQAVAMYVRAGDLSEAMHQTLLLLVDSTHVTPATEKAGIRQIIDTLGELNDILDHHSPAYLDQVMRFITEVNFG